MALISEKLAAFAKGLSFNDIPEGVARTAKYLILDAAGIALASSTYEFGQKTVKSLERFGSGDADVIGFQSKLALRDAVLANGVLIHGLDFDDTHTIGFVHGTSGCFSTALGVAANAGASGQELLTAYVLGMEVAARVGAVAKGEFQQIGFHPTGLVAAFACSLIAGKLYGLSAEEMVMAQGIALSMAAGNREYSSDASGTKRLHPGWAGVCGISAAVLAQGGFTAPRTAYEGRFGLYATHLRSDAPVDYAPATRDLGRAWETLQVSIKPYPVGHFNVAFIDAAIALSKKHRIRADDIAAIEALVPAHALKIVCEPAEVRKRPPSSYAAQFSIQFAIACGLLRQRLGLAELKCYEDPQLLAVAQKVSHRVDPHSGYPKYLSGEVIVTLKNGERLAHREQINRGAPDNPLSETELVDKFMQNAELAVPRAHAGRIRDSIRAMDRAGGSARELARSLALSNE